MGRARRLLALLALLSFGLSATEPLLADTRVEVGRNGGATVLVEHLAGSDATGSENGLCPPGCACPCPCPAPSLLQPDPPSASLSGEMGTSVPAFRAVFFSSISHEPRVRPPLS